MRWQYACRFYLVLYCLIRTVVCWLALILCWCSCILKPVQRKRKQKKKRTLHCWSKFHAQWVIAAVAFSCYDPLHDRLNMWPECLHFSGARFKNVRVFKFGYSHERRSTLMLAAAATHDLGAERQEKECPPWTTARHQLLYLQLCTHTLHTHPSGACHIHHCRARCHTETGNETDKNSTTQHLPTALEKNTHKKIKLDSMLSSAHRRTST